jgi:hypothetical protein
MKSFSQIAKLFIIRTIVTQNHQISIGQFWMVQPKAAVRFDVSRCLPYNPGNHNDEAIGQRCAPLSHFSCSAMSRRLAPSLSGEFFRLQASDIASSCVDRLAVSRLAQIRFSYSGKGG